MPSILPGSGNAKYPSSRKMVLGKNDAADDILDQIARSKAQNVQKNLLFNFLFGLNLLKNLPGKLWLLERGTSGFQEKRS